MRFRWVAILLCLCLGREVLDASSPFVRRGPPGQVAQKEGVQKSKIRKRAHQEQTVWGEASNVPVEFPDPFEPEAEDEVQLQSAYSALLVSAPRLSGPTALSFVSSFVVNRPPGPFEVSLFHPPDAL